MPSNEQPKTLSDYTPSEWKRGKVIKSTNLNNIENQIDILTDQVLNIGNRLVEFVGANSTTDGNKGVVPAPRAGDENKYLKGDGSWETPAIKYNINDSSIIEGNGTFDMNGNITAQTFSGSGENLTNISGTEVSLATSSAAGAMSSADKVKLDELPTNTQLQTNYVSKSSVSDASGIPNADTTQYGLVKIGSNINVDNGTISIPLATDNSFGVIQLGTGLTISNGIVSNDLNIKNGDGDKSIRINKSGVATGQYSCAEGYRTQAKGSYSHAEGQGYGSSSSITDFGALGTACHSEGCFTVAKNTGAHAEGYYSSADGVGAHAEGYNNTANGRATHAEGLNTIANHKSQHVFGEYNISDSSSASQDERGNYIEIVGNGYSDANRTNRSNARTLDWSGNEWLAGSISASNFKLNNYDISFGVGETLWTTPDTSQFEGKTITLSGENKNNYDFYVVCFLYNHEYAYKILFNPGRLHTNIDEIRRESFTSSGVFEHAYRRNIVVARSGNSIYIGNCIRYNYTNLNNGTIDNTVLIPLNVIGYYLGRAISSFPS